MDFYQLCKDADEKLRAMLKYFPNYCCTFSEPIMMADDTAIYKIYLHNGAIKIEDSMNNIYGYDDMQFPQVLAFLTMVDMEMMNLHPAKYRSVR